MATAPFIEMTSGYLERSRAALPLQGDRAPWRLRQHYTKDAELFREPIDDQELAFARGPSQRAPYARPGRARRTVRWSTNQRR